MNNYDEEFSVKKAGCVCTTIVLGLVAFAVLVVLATATAVIKFL